MLRPGSLLPLALLPALLLAAPASDVISPNPEALVRKVVEREVAASQNSSVNHMFVSRKQTEHGSQTRRYVETSQAMAGMTIAYDDKPLSTDQQKAEQDRLDSLVRDPAELEKKRAREKEDAERVRRIVRALPDAFIFDNDGTEAGRPGLGKPGSDLVRLKFHPNPTFQPPTRVEEILTGMEGVLLVDPKQLRIARIDGVLVREVGFGWGILGHLDKGGRFFVEQQDLGDGTWDVSRMTLRFTGKILLFKHLDIQSDEVYRDYRPVPSNLTFAQGVDMLKKHGSTDAHNSFSPQTPAASTALSSP
jgi:hypothetical protein